ncbi:MAG: ATP-dependent DNA helicase RecG [Gaiellales bacterium]
MSTGDDPFRLDPRERARPRSAPDPRALAVPLEAPARARPSLARRGLETAGDLLETPPRTYRDYGAATSSVIELHPGDVATVRGRVEWVRERPTRRRNLRVVTAQVVDETGGVTAVWFNQRHLTRVLEPGSLLQVHGEVREGRGGTIELAVREHEIIAGADGDAGQHTVGIVPVYDATSTLSSRLLHDLVTQHRHRLDAVADPLPARLRVARRLPLRRDALAAMHAPRSEPEPWIARRRLAYEELLLLQLALLRRRRELDAAAPAHALPPPAELARAYHAGLPFSLTGGQRRVIRELERDLRRTRPMRRLLLGDVGSGKTVIAAHALVRAVEAGGQGALMAPTETLAQQHATTLRGLLEPIGLSVELVTGDVPAAERRARLQRLASGDASIAVGTHALLERGVEFDRLLVAIVDEQHRFGVEQRAGLAETHGAHALYMTATPIPRSLALGLYGDLDVSELRELPPGRRPVSTHRVPEGKRAACYTWLKGQWNEHGRQAYVICSLVEGSETVQARAAEDEHEHLVRELEPLRVGLVHGRLATGQKAEAMRAFAARETQVLVATTVIEVGIDIPNATAIVVENADRFGLAQLHQLRGRVGRGADQSYCYLFESSEATEGGLERLDALTRHASGFELAELDLRMRGEGQLSGERQAGASDLRHARLATAGRLLHRARADARYLDAQGLVDPVLEAAIEARFGGLLERMGRA